MVRGAIISSMSGSDGEKVEVSRREIRNKYLVTARLMLNAEHAPYSKGEMT